MLQLQLGEYLTDGLLKRRGDVFRTRARVVFDGTHQDSGHAQRLRILR